MKSPLEALSLRSVKNARRCNRLSVKRRSLTAELLEDRRLLASGPYAPAAGQSGSTAIAIDDTAIVGWASAWENYLPGAEVDAQWQTPDKALGVAAGSSTDIVSLGRGGQITLRFDVPIRDGLGYDFAVFENGVTDTFLELAFVEVSSNGIDFVRFPSDSLTAETVGAFDEIDPTNIDGLAGKYRQGFGTPFDLSVLADASSLLDVSAVTHVRLVDIVGDGSVVDTSGKPIYDPYPTVGSAGFDLDAIAVMNQAPVIISTFGFEDLGETLSAESSFNGPAPDGTIIIGAYEEPTTIGQFISDDVSLNNAYATNSGAWNGWAYSNRTDTTTAGFGNQFSAFAGGGANQSATYAVGFVDQSDFYDPPTITLPSDAGFLRSIQVTNTTYAALSMIDGDSFAKKFGGSTGTDPDWFLLTIEGRDDSGDSVGSVEHHLADYRFDDSNLDYVVDSWQQVDLSALEDAASLQFRVTSSDVGTWGMNTPAYFAVDELIWLQPGLALDLLDHRISEDAGVLATTARVTRGGNQLDDPLLVQLATDLDSIIIPASVTIPAGSAFVDFAVGVVDNEVVDGDSQAKLTASVGDDLIASRTLSILDDDIPGLLLSESVVSIVEGEQTVMTLSRQGSNTTVELVVELQNPEPSILSVPATVTIPAGADSVEFTISAVDDELVLGNRNVTITASSDGFSPATVTVEVIDNDQPTLRLTTNQDVYSEADAPRTTLFEDVGARLDEQSFDNGADGAGGFISNALAFNNSYDPMFGSWSGWAYSNTTDTQTAGFTNQYSAITGGGARGSETYAIASAYGIDPPSITREADNGIGFQQISITNTTYAALSMAEGDMFAKKFGGETGDDPDYFLLSIEGIDAAGASVGTVDFYLADFRFEDNSLDYIIDDWVNVDVSSLTAATKLQFTLSSSDVGSFGMNTPAYFAVDDVVIAQQPESIVQPTLTVHREKTDLTEPLDVSLSIAGATNVSIPSQVTIPAGQTSLTVPMQLVDDAVAGGERQIVVTATAESFAAGSSTITMLDDDPPTVTLTISTDQVVESATNPTAGFEDIGLRLLEQSYYNGADGAGQFRSAGLQFNNSYDPTFGSWSGWALSNTTDTTTAGFGNQFSAFAGSGAGGSSTYAVGTAFEGGTTEIRRGDDSEATRFDSLMVTNTTYAALSMLQGDMFAKRFGGESGDDPDWFLLTIEGIDAEGAIMDKIDFYLADYRYIDNSRDYLVDEWTRIDLTKVADADRLRFSLTSSDVGTFGMNTPAYFAIDDVRLVSDTSAQGSGFVHRNDADLSEPLTVSLAAANHANRLSLPESVTIPAGQRRASFDFDAIDNAVVDGDVTVTVRPAADGYVSVGDQTQVIDNDQPFIGLWFDIAAVRETDPAGTITGVVARSDDDTSDALTVSLSTNQDSLISLPPTVTIPAGSRSVAFVADPVHDQRVTGNVTATVTASADNYESTAKTLSIVDVDVTGIEIVETDGATEVSESGTSDTINVRLTAKPLTDVVLLTTSLSPTDFEVDVNQLVFTPDNWDQFQVVTVTGLPDFLIEQTSQHPLRIEVDNSRSDDAFALVTPIDVMVTVDEYAIENVELVAKDGQLLIQDTDSSLILALIENEDGLVWNADDRTQSLIIGNLDLGEKPIQLNLDGGDDTVEILNASLGMVEQLSIDGGDGHDTLIVQLTDGSVDLGQFFGNRFAGFEQVIVNSSSSATISIDTFSSAVAEPGNAVLLRAGASTLVVSESWQLDAPEMVDSEFAQVLRKDDVKFQVVSDFPWQNVRQPRDVDNSGRITASDALAVINRLQMPSGADLPVVDDLDLFGGLYYDVNADGVVTASDALSVINWLNQNFDTDAGQAEKVRELVITPTFVLPSDATSEPVDVPVRPATKLPAKMIAQNAVTPHQHPWADQVDVVMSEPEKVAENENQSQAISEQLSLFSFRPLN